jgi:hypothetical protein
VAEGHAVDDRSVRWGQAPLAFELVSSDPGILCRARVVFRPWAHAGVSGPLRCWSVDRTASGAWLIHAPGDSSPLWRPTAEAAVRAIEFLAVNDLVECPEATTLHAALVARGERGIAILGPAEAGKSTLAAALWQRGFSLLGDDLVIVDPAGVRAWPAPRRVSLRATSRDLLGETVWRRIVQTPAYEVTEDACLFHPDEVESRPRFSRVRLTALVFLGRRHADSEPAQATLLPPAQALLAVLPYSNLIRRQDAGTVIRHFQPLVTNLPSYDLGRGAIDAMTATIERLIAGPT